jgi:hypothetical protein
LDKQLLDLCSAEETALARRQVAPAAFGVANACCSFSLLDRWTNAADRPERRRGNQLPDLR